MPDFNAAVTVNMRDNGSENVSTLTADISGFENIDAASLTVDLTAYASSTGSEIFSGAGGDTIAGGEAILFLVKLEMMNYLVPAATMNCMVVPEMISTGGSNSDTLIGGRGADTFIIDVSDEEATDTIKFSALDGDSINIIDGVTDLDLWHGLNSPALGSAIDVWLTESADGYSLNIETKQIL